MELIKRLSLILLLLCTTSSLWSNGGLQFKGKLRILRPTTLQVKDLKPCFDLFHQPERSIRNRKERDPARRIYAMYRENGTKHLL